MQTITPFILAALLIVGAQAAPKPSEQQTSASSSQGSPVVVVPVQPQANQQASPSDPSQVHSQQGQQAQQGHSQYVSPFNGYYAPAGIVSVVSGPSAAEPPHANPSKPQAVSRSVEQYGQPESTAIPPNYKPFGSWGLYIGGNPADGYYTNYYKALSASVQNEKIDKPQTVLKASAPTGEAYYPYAYPQGELSTVYPHQVNYQPVSSAYGSPAYEPSVVYEHAAPEAYATGRKVSQKEVVKSEAKAYAPAQSRVYVYSPPIGAAHTAPAPVVTRSQQEHQQQQVVAYPVPVGSQIVGSQTGVDGAFYPYGVHAFTRYVVKPTLVGQETHPVAAQHSPAAEGAYSGPSVSAPIGHQPAYRVYYANGGYYQPYYSGNYYGYPVSQLHYSASSHSNVEHPEVHPSGIHHHPFGPVGFKPAGISADGKPADESKPVEGVSVDKKA